MNPFNKICSNLQNVLTMQKVNNVNAYKKLATQKGKMTFKNKVEPQNKMEQSFNSKLE